MRIVEYILDPQDKSQSYHPKTIPSFITDGGYWFNPDGSEKMIGIGSDDGEIPDTMTTYTSEELQTRQLGIHAKYPMYVDAKDGEILEEFILMTEAEVRESIQSWVDARN